MKLLEKTENNVRSVTYKLEDEEFGIIIYKEYLNDKNKVIDEEIRDGNGDPIDCPTIHEKITEYVDSLEDQEDENDEEKPRHKPSSDLSRCKRMGYLHYDEVKDIPVLMKLIDDNKLNVENENELWVYTDDIDTIDIVKEYI